MRELINATSEFIKQALIVLLKPGGPTMTQIISYLQDPGAKNVQKHQESLRKLVLSKSSGRTFFKPIPYVKWDGKKSIQFYLSPVNRPGRYASHLLEGVRICGIFSNFRDNNPARLLR